MNDSPCPNVGEMVLARNRVFLATQLFVPPDGQRKLPIEDLR